MIIAFGHVYIAGVKLNEDQIFSLFLQAKKESINFENRISLLAWLDNKNISVASNFFKSLSKRKFKQILENFHKKNLQAVTVNQRKFKPSYDSTKAPEYQYTNDSGQAFLDSPSRGIKPPETPLINNRRIQKSRSS